MQFSDFRYVDPFQRYLRSKSKVVRNRAEVFTSSSTATCALTATSKLLSGRATTTLMPCDTCVIWLLKRQRHHLVTDRLLQLAGVWRPCCSSREAADSSKQ